LEEEREKEYVERKRGAQLFAPKLSSRVFELIILEHIICKRNQPPDPHIFRNGQLLSQRTEHMEDFQNLPFLSLV